MSFLTVFIFLSLTAALGWNTFVIGSNATDITKIDSQLSIYEYPPYEISTDKVILLYRLGSIDPTVRADLNRHVVGSYQKVDANYAKG
jgi:hypothetical protein